MSQLLDFARQILASQPFSVFLGAQLDDVGADHAQISLSLRPEHLQQNGFAHGGVLSYLADNAITFAGGLALGGGDVLTSEFKINYLRPGKGEQLIARASTRGAGRRQAVCHCDIYVVNDHQEKLCAVAQGTVVKTGD